MTNNEILTILSEIVDEKTGKKMSEIVEIDAVTQTEEMMKLRVSINGISPADKQHYRKAIEAKFDEKKIDVLVTVVTEISRGEPTSQQTVQAQAPKPFLPQEVLARFKKTIAVYSTKGGVGKSTVSATLSLSLAHRGLKVAVIDLDIYGPSMPRILGNKKKIKLRDNKFIPMEVAHGIHMMSVGSLISDVESPLIWRAPIVNGVIAQIYSDTDWDQEYDVLVLDMPPGTGDINIIAAQSLNIDAVIAVSTPQGVALEDTVKGLTMYKKFDIPIIGLAFNMGSVICGNCETLVPIYPRNQEFQEFLATNEIKILADLPMDPKITELADKGELINIDVASKWGLEFNRIVDAVEKFVK